MVEFGFVSQLGFHGSVSSGFCLCDQNVGNQVVDAVAELLTARHHCDDWE